MNRGPPYPPRGPTSPPPSSQKSQILHVLRDFDWIWNTIFSYVYQKYLGQKFMNRSPLIPRGPLSLCPSKKSNSSFIVWFSWNLKHKIFICLPIIIEVEIYEQGPPYSPGPPPPLPLKIVKFFIYGAILLKFEKEHLQVFTNNDLTYNL